MPAAVPWWKTGAFRGLLVIIITSALSRFHIIALFTPDEIGTYADDIIGLMSGIGIYMVAHARVTQNPTVPPPVVTLTKAKADTINAASDPLSQTPESK